MIQPLPILQYPLTIACIDDDLLFLKAISKTLNKNYNIKSFHNSVEALNFFKEYKPFLTPNRFLTGCVENENYNNLSNAFVKFNIENISDLMTDEAKSNDIGILIVDYKMPILNGIELCRALKELPIKKILLTGEADNPDAINAFNEGIIDRYIRKDIQDLASILKEYINNLMTQYFFEKTQLLVSHLEIDNQFPSTDRLFSDYFNNLCKKNDIKEYYLLDKFGSFYLVNNKKEILYLITHTDQTLNSFVEVYSDVEWAQEFLDKIKNRELIPFFGVGKEPWQVSENDWNHYMFKPDVLKGTEHTYYISFTKFKNV